MNSSQAIASSIGSVNFGFLLSSDIRALSVKQIRNPDTFDTLLHPTPGGLYDLALGAFSDNPCETCHLGSYGCPGHPGHIELPVPVYHVSYMPQLLMLLRAKCAYCSHFRATRSEMNRLACMMRLVHRGLLKEAKELEEMDIKTKELGGSDDESDADKEDKAAALIERRSKFVRKALKEVGNSKLSPEKVEAVAVERRRISKEFYETINKANTCATCSGISPNFRKDGFRKIFRMPLSDKIRSKMIQSEKRIINHLLEQRSAKEIARKEKLADREADEGIVPDIHSPRDDESDIHETREEGTPPNGQQIDDIASDESDAALPGKHGYSKVQEYVNPEEVLAALSALFEKEQEILHLIYHSGPMGSLKQKATPHMFFVWTLFVPPTKFRPEAKAAGLITEAQQNSLYKNILRECETLNQIRLELSGHVESSIRKRTFLDFQNSWVVLQDAVNSLFDSERNPTRARGNQQLEEGIKQKLEKKEGLFRKNMMGKRVNFAARSVISPDPNLETNEIGVPLVFAKKLTYPEPVTSHNFYELKEAVINGTAKWPGAAAIENENGQVINLKNKNFDERQALANQLLAPSSNTVNGARNKKVHRHLNNGDMVIMNRQPTLHKPSMMAHRARILPGEKTIRMHYANCNTYNADFDGDEMNLHFPQNEIARAEALQIADTDHQYLVATSGKPLRGLIQDHISVSVWLTSRDTFFTREDYQQLLYSSLRPENNDTITGKIETVPPTVVRPIALWTGKQVITTVLKNITSPDHSGLTLTGKSQIQSDRWSDNSEEGQVIFQSGEFLCGILDKASIGPSTGSLVHSVYEAYGHTTAGKLLSILGRLLTRFQNLRAFSCGMEDIVLTKEGNRKRLEKLREAKNLGHDVASKYVTLDSAKDDDPLLQTRLEEVLRDEQKQAGLDSVYNARTATLSSEITKVCLPAGLQKQFPKNQMQTMTVSGAKGSAVNANLISCNLGQQVLEGRRVPVMVSGKTLPSFKPFDTSVRAGGYIMDRFLTGVSPQEYFFHAMAGREGLIDTAVKTSRSGYLQRCLIKGMEGLKVEYDTSVRDSDGSMVQFLYGEDGLDITKQKQLMEFKFAAENFMAIIAQLNVQEAYEKLFSDKAADWNKKALKSVKKAGRMSAVDPVLSQFNPSSNWGSTSELFAAALKDYVEKNPQKLIKDKKTAPKGTLSKKTFTTLLDMKYMKSTIDPGEAVGIVAGQSIGEPSTQMTLNTFHLAGHSAKNVTLGIPRLREIVMTASANISTPTMTLNLHPETTEEEGQKFAKGITKLTLAEVTDEVTVTEMVSKGVAYERAKVYKIRIDLFPSKEYEEIYAIKVAEVLRTIETKFISLLERAVRKDLHAKGEAELSQPSSSRPEIGIAVKKARPVRGKAGTGENGNEETAENAAAHDRTHANDDSENENDPDDDATQFKQKNRGADAYDAPDEEEEAIAKQARAGSVEPDEDSDKEMDDEGYGGSPRTVADEDDDDGSQKMMRSKAKERESDLLSKHRDLTRFAFDDEDGAWCELTFEYDITTPKIIMLNHVEFACRETVIQFIPGLGACTYLAEKGKEPYVLTEGVNLLAMRDYQHIIDPTRIFTNDIHAVLTLYGVEAARATIIAELRTVFDGHSIQVDARHLNLIADVMTRGGAFAPFSRTGMKNSVSPFAKMSFETTVGFLKDAVLEADHDDLKGPSARIVMGKVSGVGTGAFDVFTRLPLGENVS